MCLFVMPFVSSVLFDIKLPASMEVFSENETIRFTNTIINYGNGYRTDLGIFEPPVNGVYSFTVTICSYVDTWMVVGLMKDREYRFGRAHGRRYVLASLWFQHNVYLPHHCQ